MKIGVLELQLQRPQTKNHHPDRERIKVAVPNISAGAEAPQHSRGLLNLLLEHDEGKVTSLLASSDGSSPRQPSPFTGRLLEMYYDPVEVLDLVDSIWPSRLHGHPGPGNKPKDPLPIVCYLLPFCDPEYGTVFNLAEARRRLEADKEYRRECGYVDGIPSLSVFRNTLGEMIANWDRFQECLLSPEDMEVIRRRFFRDNVRRDVFSPLLGFLSAAGWREGLPPLYRDDGQVSKALRVVGKPRGKTCGSGAVPGANGVQIPPIDGCEASRSPVKRFPRDWPAYNLAQAHEPEEVKALLGGFSDLINLAEAEVLGPKRGSGRPPFPLGHVAYSVVLKEYYRCPTRPIESFLREAVELGYLRNLPTYPALEVPGSGCAADSGVVRIPSYNGVGYFERSQWLTPLLLELVTLTALPLRGVEREFAVDGTGWSTRWYDRWLDHRLAEESDRQQWVKLHLVVGCNTNVVARAAISPGSHHDNPYFIPLLIETAKHFDVDLVLADMGYLSHPNYEVGPLIGAEIRIPFKENTLPPSYDGSEWDRILQHYYAAYETFMEEYHRRSNAESAIGAIKATRAGKIRTKLFNAQVNEALALLVAYNLRVLAREVRMKKLALDLRTDWGILQDIVRQVVGMRSPHLFNRAA